MLKQSVLGLGVAAAVCMPAASANARYNYINLSASAVNGEIVQIDRMEMKLDWRRPADASVPAAHFVLELGTGGLFVSFEKFEHGGRKFGGRRAPVAMHRPVAQGRCLRLDCDDAASRVRYAGRNCIVRPAEVRLLQNFS